MPTGSLRQRDDERFALDFVQDVQYGIEAPLGPPHFSGRAMDQRFQVERFLVARSQEIRAGAGPRHGGMRDQSVAEPGEQLVQVEFPKGGQGESAITLPQAAAHVGLCRARQAGEPRLEQVAHALVGPRDGPGEPLGERRAVRCGRAGDARIGWSREEGHRRYQLRCDLSPLDRTAATAAATLASGVAIGMTQPGVTMR